MERHVSKEGMWKYSYMYLDAEGGSRYFGMTWEVGRQLRLRQEDRASGGSIWMRA